jgi:polygalacturonase
MPDPKKQNLSRRKWLGLFTTAAVVTGVGKSSASFGQETFNHQKNSGKDNGTNIYNIRDFGARGDGITLDTSAIQSAIDVCHKDQGGTVMVPAGIFLTGTIELKSNVTLHIAAQGKILGSGDGRQYHAASAIPTTGEWTMGDGNVALIFAANAENICIEGQGTIDGQGSQFRSTVRGEVPPSGIGGNRRPHHLLFYQCKNVTIRDIFLTACAYHSVRVCVCSFVKMDGIRIHSRVNSNNDGFHFISSQHVHISNCDVQCQDDACALFGSNKFVTITNCSFSTRWSVFRFGGGFSENITVSNCIIYETYGCPIKMRCDGRSRFENISFSNIIMKDVTGPISIGLGPQRRQPGEAPQKPGIIKNISFNGIQATVVKPAQHPDLPFQSNYNPGEIFSCIILNGMEEGFLENISFNDVQVTYPGGGTAEQAATRDVPKIAGEYYAIGVPPAYGLYARNVKGLELHNVKFQAIEAELRPALIMDHVKDAAIHSLCIDGDKDAESTLRLIESEDVLLTATRLIKPAGVFLQVEGAGSKNISIEGGSLSNAARLSAFTSGAQKSAVIFTK